MRLLDLLYYGKSSDDKMILCSLYFSAITSVLCDRIVLGKLYIGLQKLATGEREGAFAEDEVELHDLSLPSPSTSSHTHTPSMRDVLPFLKQEKFSRWIFSICFAESCILLLLFVCELVNALDVPYVQLVY